MATTETILEATIKAGVEHFGGFPSGTMIAFAGKSVPDGWLLCNGALVSRTTYAKLFKAIGTAWGAGNGSTTFKLPDADGRVMQGVTDAAKVGQYLEAGLPNITGTLSGRRMSLYSAYLFPEVDGAFSMATDASIKDRGQVTTKDIGGECDNYFFSAKKSNSVYSGSGVQPNALQALIIIKI